MLLAGQVLAVLGAAVPGISVHLVLADLELLQDGTLDVEPLLRR